ncbi:hypothetical protein BDY24DRAFT_397108 [Mrakia frigida]|uniref:uncharacterized protein n=1 Tax=Mrakia frigida TaxID=29902 RepID=UPI003FCBEEEC
MPSLPPSKPKSEPITCTPESIPSTIELEDEEYISLQGACSGEGAKRRKVLPKSIVEEGGIFTTVCLFKVKRGQGDKVVRSLIPPLLPELNLVLNLDLPRPPFPQVEQFKKVHKETDEMELSVYSHRVMRGFGDDEDQIAVVIECRFPYLSFVLRSSSSLFPSPSFQTTTLRPSTLTSKTLPSRPSSTLPTSSRIDPNSRSSGSWIARSTTSPQGW